MEGKYFVFDSHAHLGLGLKRRSMFVTHTGEQFVTLMDESGIDMSVVFPPIWEGPLFEGQEWVDPNYEHGNQEILEAVRQYPDRLFGYVRCNPNFGARAQREMRKYVEEYKFRGLKLHPDWESWMGGNRELYAPMLELAKQYTLPCYIHVGYYPKCQPLLFMQMAEEYPTVPIILGHIGYEYHRDAILVAKRNPNVYLETAGNSHAWIIAEAVRQATAKQVLYGSDAPFFDPKWVISKISLHPGLTDEEKQLMLGGNMARLLKVQVPNTTAAGKA